MHISNEVNPSGPPGRTVTVSVPAGASTARIADLLAKAGVIHGPTVFALYVKIEAAGSLLPGTYHLATNEPYSKVVAALENGPGAWWSSSSWCPRATRSARWRRRSAGSGG